MKEKRFWPLVGRLELKKKKRWDASLQRFSFSYSGIDFVEDVFVTSPDD